MANHAEILRYIDSIARDKEIDKEALISGIEQAMSLALAVARLYPGAVRVLRDRHPQWQRETRIAQLLDNMRGGGVYSVRGTIDSATGFSLQRFLIKSTTKIG